MDHFLFVHHQQDFLENQLILLSLHFRYIKHAKIMLKLISAPWTDKWPFYKPEFYQGRADLGTFVEWQIDALECEGHPPLLNWSNRVRGALTRTSENL